MTLGLMVLLTGFGALVLVGITGQLASDKDSPREGFWRMLSMIFALLAIVCLLVLVYLGLGINISFSTR